MKKIIFLSVCLFSSLANASITYDDSATNSITVSWDETFTMTSNSSELGASYLFLIAENLFETSDGDGYLSDISSMAQTVSINGGSATNVTNWAYWQYRAGPELDYDQLDGLFGLSNDSLLPTFNIGDSFRWAGSMTVNETAIYRMPDIQGETTAYLANNNGRFSDTINTTINPSAVPVPAAVWLFGSGLLGLIATIKRRRLTA